MPFHFTEKIVVATYRHRFPGDNDPSLSDLREWDKSLKTAWEVPLRDVLPEFPDIDGTDKEIRSTIMMLARFSEGSNRRGSVKSACIYFQNTSDLGV